jgi:chitinase
LDKIVVGKPVTQGDATNTGWMDIGILSSSVGRAKKEGKWSAGVMFWQYSSDSTGEAIKTVTSSLQASW